MKRHLFWFAAGFVVTALVLTLFFVRPAGGTGPTVWVYDCSSSVPLLSSSEIVFTGSPAGAQAFVAAHPGACWVVAASSPVLAGLPPLVGSSSTTTTLPNPCDRKGYEASHEKQCGPLR